MPSPKLYREMVAYLEAMITSGAYAPGDKLPAQRDLCIKFNLTKGTAGRGLASLEKHGLIELRHGAGAFVRRREKNANAAYNIGVLLERYNPDGSYCGRILSGVQRRAAALGCGLHLQFTPHADYSPEMLERYAEQFDAVMLIGIYDTVARELPRTRPCVAVNMHNAYGFASTVDLDPVMTAELAADYFRQRGRHRIICCSPPKPKGVIADVFDFRAKVFEANWPGEFRMAAIDAENAGECLRLSDDDTGFLFVSGSNFERCARAVLQETGRRLADEICVLSIDAKSRIIPEFQPVDTIGPDYPAMGELAFDECLRRIENPGSGPRRIYQHVQLFESISGSQQLRKGRKKP